MSAYSPFPSPSRLLLKSRTLTVAGFASLCALGMAHAHDLGTVGDVYPIAEPDFLVEAKAIVKRKVDDGSWAAVERKLRQDTVNALEHPAAVGSFAVASTPKVRYFDPTATLTQDIVGPNGQVVFTAGTKVNPLDVVKIDSNLFFFDADDPRQVAAFLSAQAKSPIHVKAVAVAGSYLALARKLEQPVYFDQAASFTRRLGITVVPTLVSQEGNRLRIEEMVPQ